MMMMIKLLIMTKIVLSMANDNDSTSLFYGGETHTLLQNTRAFPVHLHGRSTVNKERRWDA